MNRSELVARLTRVHPGLRHKDLENVVTTIFEEIAAGLARGDRAEIRGFGSFSVRRRRPRVGRNPRTGERVEVPEKHVPYFRAGRRLRETVDGGGS